MTDGDAKHTICACHVLLRRTSAHCNLLPLIGILIEPPLPRPFFCFGVPTLCLLLLDACLPALPTQVYVYLGANQAGQMASKEEDLGSAIEL